MEKDEFSNHFGELVEIEDEKWGKYLSFIPNSLPPIFEFDNQLVFSLNNAQETLSKLAGVGLLLPNPNLLVSPYLKKEALASSRIEGTRISLDEYFLSEVQEKQEDNINVKEVLNYIKSINYALDKIDKEPISIDLIKEMHKILMDGVRGNDKYPGNFRDVQNWIGAPGTNPQSAHFVPPPPERVEELMKEMIRYMDTFDEVPLLIKCAFMHYQFETIHPFCDGNGRIGRALIILYFIKKGKISKPLLYISGFFEKYKPDYTELLSKANKKGTFKEWLLFFLEAVKVQSEDALDKAMKLQKLKEKYRQLVQTKTNINSVLEIVDNLFINPYITVNKAKEITNTSYPTAKKSIETLIELGVLKERENSGERNKIFRAQEVLEVIFN
jgi:Fic family protein